MSFSFGFSGDDIDAEEETDYQARDDLTHDMSKHRIAEEQSSQHSVPAKRHSLEELLVFLPSQISYNTLSVPTSTSSTNVYRRALFDIRTQLMTEADPSTPDGDSGELRGDSASTLLSGLENGDLSTGIYEGGFKTWECAVDLASFVLTQLPGLGDADWDVVELGAGSAVPTLALSSKFLERQNGASGDGKLRLTLCDYNTSVLRLATAPNILLNYLASSTDHLAPSAAEETTMADGEGDLDIEAHGDSFIPTILSTLNQQNLSIDFISGEWGPDFVSLFSSTGLQDRPSNLLILASETIYSPTSIEIFTSTLLSCLRLHRQIQPRGSGKARALVAAKKVYFGVGGGVDEFIREVTDTGGLCQVVFESRDTGVGRVIVEVTLKD